MLRIVCRIALDVPISQAAHASCDEIDPDTEALDKQGGGSQAIVARRAA